jgi:hypothetical protein
VSVPDGNQLQLQADHIGLPNFLSPDGNWLLTGDTLHPGGAFGYHDYSLVSTTAAVAPIRMATMGDGKTSYGAYFTADGAFALIGIGPEATYDESSALVAQPLDEGAPSRINRMSINRWATLSGSRVLLSEYLKGGLALANAQLDVVDVRYPSSAAPLGMVMYPEFALSADRKTVWFSTPDGIYSALLPE